MKRSKYLSNYQINVVFATQSLIIVYKFLNCQRKVELLKNYEKMFWIFVETVQFHTIFMVYLLQNRYFVVDIFLDQLSVLAFLSLDFGYFFYYILRLVGYFLAKHYLVKVKINFTFVWYFPFPTSLRTTKSLRKLRKNNLLSKCCFILKNIKFSTWTQCRISSLWFLIRKLTI